MKILLSIFALLLVGIIGLEIYSADTSTKIETTLFGIMQFVFSIAIGWLLSRNSASIEFIEKQRQFATSAYRRIREVESTVSRLMSDLQVEIKKSSLDETKHPLKLALVRAEEILETTESSKLDWADIIGEEISKIEKIEKLNRSRTLVKSDSDREVGNIISDQKLHDIEKKLEDIKSSLPEQFKLIAELEEIDKNVNAEALEEVTNRGFITLTGFADTDMGFTKDVAKCELGQELIIGLEDYGRRIATLIARDNEGQRLGSFIRKYSGNYSDFTHAICLALNSSEFQGKIVSMDERVDMDDKPGGKYERQYFTVHAFQAKKA